MRRLLRGTAALYIGHLLGWLRSRTAIYWTLAFPLFFLIMFGMAFRGRVSINELMPGLLTITVISGSLFGVALRMVTERETGILRRHRLTPVHPIAVVLAHGGLALTTLLISLFVQSVLAALIFGFTIQGSIVALVVVLLMGGLALIPIGLVVGSVARDTRVAPAMTNFLFFPLMFLSGAAIPSQFLPEWLRQVALLIPSTYVVDLLKRVIVQGARVVDLGAVSPERPLSPMLMLGLTSVIGVTVNAMLFRWESTEPVRKSRLLAALGVLAVIYGAEYLAATMHVAHPGG